MKRLGFLFFLVFHLSLFASRYEVRLMDQAKNYVEAGDQEKAESIYLELLNGNQEEWKKSLIRYNLATSYLEGGNPVEAIKLFNATPLGKEPFPLLSLRIKTNLAIARYRIVKEITEKIKDNSDYSEEEYIKVIFLLQKSLRDIREATAFHCKLLEIEGDPTCEPLEDLNALRRAIQLLLTNTQLYHIKRSTEQVTPKQGVSLLVAGLFAIQEEIKELATLSMPQEILEEQINRIVEQAETWNTLWKKLIEEKNSTNFHHAYQQFEQFLIALKAGHLKKGVKTLKGVEEKLGKIMAKLFDHDSLLEIIQKLSVSYERAELMIPVQEGTLKSLLEEQKAFTSLLVRKKLESPTLSRANQKLQLSLQLARVGKYKTSRVYLISAFQKIKRLKWEFQKEHRIKALLKQLISEQLTNILINHLIQEVEGEEEIKGKGLDSQSQELTLKLAAKFWDKAYQEQLRSFYATSKEEETTPCQYQPWNSVMPLFDQGYEEALIALKHIKDLEDQESGIVHQDRAMRLFREALEKLEQTPPQKSCQMEGAAEEEPSEQQESPPSSSINKVLSLLKQMEQNDREQKGKSGTVRELENKSW